MVGGENYVFFYVAGGETDVFVLAADVASLQPGWAHRGSERHYGGGGFQETGKIYEIFI